MIRQPPRGRAVDRRVGRALIRLGLPDVDVADVVLAGGRRDRAVTADDQHAGCRRVRSADLVVPLAVDRRQRDACRPTADVVTDSGGRAAERLPAASRALTVNVYAVRRSALGMVADVVVGVAEAVADPLTKTSYPVTPTLSVDAVQREADRGGGLARASSGQPAPRVPWCRRRRPTVVTGRAVDAAETLPAASRARTVNEYAVFAVRPVTVVLVPGDRADQGRAAVHVVPGHADGVGGCGPREVHRRRRLARASSARSARRRGGVSRRRAAAGHRDRLVVEQRVVDAVRGGELHAHQAGRRDVARGGGGARERERLPGPAGRARVGADRGPGRGAPVVERPGPRLLGVRRAAVVGGDTRSRSRSTG